MGAIRMSTMFPSNLEIMREEEGFWKELVTSPIITSPGTRN